MKKAALFSFVLCVFMFTMCRSTVKHPQTKDKNAAVPAVDSSSQTIRLKNSVEKETEQRVKVDTYKLYYPNYYNPRELMS